MNEKLFVVQVRVMMVVRNGITKSSSLTAQVGRKMALGSIFVQPNV
ncbi:hypothetical protein [Polynucleobacter sp. MWH-S4W17]|nr:hypothetical protein [Polynucleobacter sp. MWH-S4W17]QWD82736.1 hypothetical protein C2755_08585 [Polynucleobacter sp. MWH-S4W17]